MLLKSRLPKSAAVPPTFAAAFFRDLWTPSASERRNMIRPFELDRTAYRKRAEEALLRGDHPGSVTALEMLDATNSLSRDAAQHLWSELLAVQRWGDALGLLEDPRFSLKMDASYWYDVACARAATRRLVTVKAALDKALSLEPQHQQALKLAEAVDRLDFYESGGTKGWEGLADLIDSLIDLHRYQEATARLVSFIMTLDVPLSSEHQEFAVARARTLFRVLGPHLTLILLLALKPAFRTTGSQDIIDWAVDELTTSGDSANGAPGDFGCPLELRVCLGQAFAACGKWKTAVRLFGPAATVPDDPFDCRLELARCVGRAVIGEVEPNFARASDTPKVVDVFPFFDELLLLELKLEEMAPWVDRFVLLEARTTFTGAPKELVYEQNKARFATYADKIVHHIVEFPEWADTPWAREFYQRDAALAALATVCRAEDLVLVSDADEIIDQAALDRFDGQYASLGMPLYSYFFNLRLRSSSEGTYGAVCRAKYFDRVGLSLARLGMRRYSRRERLPDAGWHFSSIKSADELVAKFRAFSHVEHSKADPAALAQLLESIIEQRGLAGCERCEIDESMPRALRHSPKRIAGYVL